MKQLTLWGVFTMILCFAGGIHAQDLSRKAKSLEGISEMRVFVDINNPADKVRMTRRSIITAIELRLRRNGIKVTDDPSQYLYVTINTMIPQASEPVLRQVLQEIVVGSVEVRFIQQARLLANNKKSFVTTWENGNILYVRTKNAPSYIKSIVNDFVDEFANDYLAANPE